MLVSFSFRSATGSEWLPKIQSLGDLLRSLTSKEANPGSTHTYIWLRSKSRSQNSRIWFKGWDHLSHLRIISLWVTKLLAYRNTRPFAQSSSIQLVGVLYVPISHPNCYFQPKGSLPLLSNLSLSLFQRETSLPPSKLSCVHPSLTINY